MVLRAGGLPGEGTLPDGAGAESKLLVARAGGGTCVWHRGGTARDQKTTPGLSPSIKIPKENFSSGPERVRPG